MEKTLEMFTEYILERCRGLETENRRLNHQVTTLTEQNDRLYGEVAQQADKMAQVAKLLKPCITWSEHPSVFLFGDNFADLCKLMRIEKDDKTAM